MKLIAAVLRLALCLAATTAGHAQTAPSATEIAAYNGLLAAAASGDAGAVSAALATADLEQRDAGGRTALHIAAHRSHYDVVRALVAAGADINAMDRQQYDVVTIAAVKDDVAMLELALSLGGNAKAITSPYQGTALIAAAHLGHAEVVRLLLQAGAPPDHVNNLGWTAAIEAVVLGDGGARHQATLRALIDAGADIRIADRNGATPLALARSRGYGEMVRMLAQAERK